MKRTLSLFIATHHQRRFSNILFFMKFSLCEMQCHQLLSRYSSALQSVPCSLWPPCRCRRVCPQHFYFPTRFRSFYPLLFICFLPSCNHCARGVFLSFPPNKSIDCRSSVVAAFNVVKWFRVSETICPSSDTFSTHVGVAQDSNRHLSQPLPMPLAVVFSLSTRYSSMRISSVDLAKRLTVY